MKVTKHGGDINAIKKEYNIEINDIIDFSSNVNPLGAPQSVKNSIIENIEKISLYPDIRYEELRNSIAEYVGANPENIMTGNGSTELISVFIKIISPRRAVIISPAYSEYQREVSLSGGESILFRLNENDAFCVDAEKLKVCLENAQLLIMCNPNNPTGSAVREEKLIDIFSYCFEKGIYVMVDETYAEFSERKDISSIPLVNKYKNVFVIRGTSKFFACPGLRLGYCVCADESIMEKANEAKDPWSVNSMAEIAGCVMFRDKKYINNTKRLILSEKNKFKRELGSLIKIYDTESNFLLAKLNEGHTSSEIFNKLIKKNIVIRNMSDFDCLGNDYIRFCILKPQHNDLLINELKNILL